MTFGLTILNAATMTQNEFILTVAFISYTPSINASTVTVCEAFCEAGQKFNLQKVRLVRQGDWKPTNHWDPVVNRVSQELE